MSICARVPAMSISVLSWPSVDPGPTSQRPRPSTGLPAQNPPYRNLLASAGSSASLSASFTTLNSSFSPSTDSMMSLCPSHSAKTETLPQGEAGHAAWSLPSREEAEYIPRVDVSPLPGSTQGFPHLIPRAPNCTAFQSSPF